MVRQFTKIFLVLLHCRSGFIVGFYTSYLSNTHLLQVNQDEDAEFLIPKAMKTKATLLAKTLKNTWP